MIFSKKSKNKNFFLVLARELITGGLSRKKILSSKPASHQRHKSSYRSYLNTGKTLQESYDTILLDKKEIEFMNRVNN